MEQWLAMVTLVRTSTKLQAKVFYALSDSTRLQILEFLRDGEKCVCEIVPHLELIQPLVSRHLKILKDAGLVHFRKDGTKRLYAIVDHKIFEVIDSLTPELVSKLKQEAIDNITCSRDS
jgi:DNA-binding transcriptional ArsR family regulator